VAIAPRVRGNEADARIFSLAMFPNVLLRRVAGAYQSVAQLSLGSKSPFIRSFFHSILDLENFLRAADRQIIGIFFETGLDPSSAGLDTRTELPDFRTADSAKFFQLRHHFLRHGGWDSYKEKNDKDDAETHCFLRIIIIVAMSTIGLESVKR